MWLRWRTRRSPRMGRAEAFLDEGRVRSSFRAIGFPLSFSWLHHCLALTQRRPTRAGTRHARVLSHPAPTGGRGYDVVRLCRPNMVAARCAREDSGSSRTTGRERDVAARGAGTPTRFAAGAGLIVHFVPRAPDGPRGRYRHAPPPGRGLYIVLVPTPGVRRRGARARRSATFDDQPVSGRRCGRGGRPAAQAATVASEHELAVYIDAFERIRLHRRAELVSHIDRNWELTRRRGAAGRVSLRCSSPVSSTP